MSDPKKNVTYNQLNFDILTSQIQKIFSKRDFNITNFNSEIRDDLHQLSVYIWKKELGVKELFSNTYIPKTWKDHFKKKHRFKFWMRWWIKRKPIQHLRIRRITIFPDVKIPPEMQWKNKIFYFEVVPENES